MYTLLEFQKTFISVRLLAVTANNLNVNPWNWMVNSLQVNLHLQSNQSDCHISLPQILNYLDPRRSKFSFIVFTVYHHTRVFFFQVELSWIMINLYGTTGIWKMYVWVKIVFVNKSIVINKLIITIPYNVFLTL